MAVIDRLSVLYDVQDQQAQAGFRRMEVASKRTNRQIVADAGRAERSLHSMQGSVGNVAAQFNDIGVTAASGMSPMLIALQQGTQLSQAFAAQGGGLRNVVGGLGAAFGQMLSPLSLVTIGITAAAAVAIQAATSFLSFGGEAEKLEDKIADLEAAVDDYRAAVDAANSPTSELADKYGLAAGKAQELLEISARLTRVEATGRMVESITAVTSRFDDLIGRVQQYQDALDNNDVEGLGVAELRLERMAESLGLSVQQAQRFASIIKDAQLANTPEQIGNSLQDVAAFLDQAVQNGARLSPELREVARQAADGSLSVLELKELTFEASGAAEELGRAIGAIDWSNAISGADALAGRIGGMIGQARTLLSTLGQAQQRNIDAESRRELLQIEREGLEAGKARAEIEGDIAAARERQKLDSADIFIPVALRNQQIEKARENATAIQQETDAISELNKAAAEAARKASTGGSGGRKRSGGSGRRGRAERPFFGDIEKDLINLQRQIELVGKSNEEVATARARWELLDEAKKRGIPVTEELQARIDAESQSIGRLTGELERAEIAQQQFEEAVDGIADAMAGALVAGESLRDGLAQVFKQIASDILNSGIHSLLSNLIPGIGGGGGFNLGSILPSFDGGGFTGYGPRTGGVDGIGGIPAILHPNETVIDHTKGQRMGGGGNVTFRPTINVMGNPDKKTMEMINRELDRQFFGRFTQSQKQFGDRIA